MSDIKRQAMAMLAGLTNREAKVPVLVSKMLDRIVELEHVVETLNLALSTTSEGNFRLRGLAEKDEK